MFEFIVSLFVVVLVSRWLRLQYGFVSLAVVAFMLSLLLEGSGIGERLVGFSPARSQTQNLMMGIIVPGAIMFSAAIFLILMSS